MPAAGATAPVTTARAALVGLRAGRAGRPKRRPPPIGASATGGPANRTRDDAIRSVTNDTEISSKVRFNFQRLEGLLDPNSALCQLPNTVGAANRGRSTIMVDRFVARHNIEHFRELISKETDESKLKTLRRLLAEEEAKLKRAIEAHRKEKD
jgi:hypothetical protein